MILRLGRNEETVLDSPQNSRIVAIKGLSRTREEADMKMALTSGWEP